MTAPAEARPETEPKSCRDVPIPSVAALSWEAYAGRSCFACDKPLTRGAVLVGRAEGRQGVHVLDTDVYACP